MNRLGTKDALLALVHYALLACMAQATGLLFGGMLKVLALAVLALLLFFVVGRSARFLKTVATCLRLVPSSLFAASTNARWTQHSQTPLILPDQPLRSLLFQRPPPPLSL